MKELLLVQGSPHKGGVCATIAAYLHKELTRLNYPSQILDLSDQPLAPCMGCNHCKRTPHRCLQKDWQLAETLFARLRCAELVFFLSPIYFYALPATTKALIDRAQVLWQRTKGTPEATKSQPVFPLLCAGRTRGEQLFQGSLLTLTYFFALLNRNITQPLLLRGLENTECLRRDATFEQQISHWLWENMASYSALHTLQSNGRGCD